jgi:hypothetical protein
MHPIVPSSTPEVRDKNMIAIAVYILLIFALFLAFKHDFQERERIRAKLSVSLSVSAPQAIIPVKFASQRRYWKLFKTYPWDGIGILIPQPDGFRVVVQTLAGQLLSFDILPHTVAWAGRKQWFINGSTSWLSVTDPESPFYLSDDHSPFLYGNHRLTKELYELLSRHNSPHERQR